MITSRTDAEGLVWSGGTIVQTGDMVDTLTEDASSEKEDRCGILSATVRDHRQHHVLVAVDESNGPTLWRTS